MNISPGGIPKRAIEVGRVRTAGIEGDGHNHAKHCTPMSAVSLIDIEDLNDFRSEGFEVHPGAMGENLTVCGLNVDGLAVGDRLRFEGGVEIEITKHRNPCYVLDAIDPRLKQAVIGRCGVLAKVLAEGEIRPGAAIEVLRAPITANAGAA